MKTAVVIQHHQFETLGSNFSRVIRESDFRIWDVPLFRGTPGFTSFEAPAVEEVDLIVALGGPMSANDQYRALELEMDYLRSAAVNGTPVLSICLGAQLLARSLGGTVEPSGGYQFGLRKLWVTEAGHDDRAFSQIVVPLVPTLHGECFTTPGCAQTLAEGFMLCRDGTYRRINMGFRYNNAYAVQFEPRLTFNELVVWNRELASDYLLMGDRFDPDEEAQRNLQEFGRFAQFHESQMAAFLRRVISVELD